VSARIDDRTGLQSLEQDECFRLLAAAPLGRLAVVVGTQPLIFPVNFALDGRAVVIRTATGTKLAGARGAPVAFECDGIDATYHTGWSVLVIADAEEVLDPLEIERIERLPVRPWSSLSETTWLRLRPKSVSGRRIPPPGRTNQEEESTCR